MHGFVRVIFGWGSIVKAENRISRLAPTWAADPVTSMLLGRKDENTLQFLVQSRNVCKNQCRDGWRHHIMKSREKRPSPCATHLVFFLPHKKQSGASKGIFVSPYLILLFSLFSFLFLSKSHYFLFLSLRSDLNSKLRLKVNR